MREEPAGANPFALGAEDFDGDGVMDLAVANGGSNHITYLQGQSGGPERLREEVAGGNLTTALATGDFNGDGVTDLAVANDDSTGTQSATVFRGGSGGLERLEQLAGGSRPIALAAADFNGDGLADLAAANRADTSPARDTVTYLKGTNDRLVQVRKLTVGSGSVALTAGDFNGDGAMDLAVANELSDNVTCLNGGNDDDDDLDGLRRAREPAEVSVGDHPVALAAGDFDADGVTDLAVANEGSSSVTYLKGGSGGLSTVEDVQIMGAAPAALAAGDFDGDGIVDVASANRDSDDVTYLRGGSRGLVREREEPAGDGPMALAAADFNGDGVTDLVVANRNSSNVTILRGGSVGLKRERHEAVGQAPVALATADFDGDGFTDLAVANSGSSNITYFRQLFFRPHPNLILDPVLPGGPPLKTLDPRGTSGFLRARRRGERREFAPILDPSSNPPFRLDLDAEDLVAPTQVCIVPGPIFEFPEPARRGAAARGRMLVRLTAQAALLLRPPTKLAGEGRLSLRVRAGSEPHLVQAFQEPERLRLFRADLETGRVEDLPLEPEEIIQTEFGRGRNLVSGLSVPVRQPGVYVVAMEFDR